MIHRFDPFYDQGWSSLPGAGPRNFMAADIYREEDRYLVAVDIPGVSEENTEEEWNFLTRMRVIGAGRPATRPRISRAAAPR